MSWCKSCGRAYGCTWSKALCPECYGKALDTRALLVAAIQALATKEHLIETNSGTYGPEEARRKVGSSAPEVAERNVYETVEGRQREEGPGATSAPGRMRKLDRTALDADRQELEALRKGLGATVMN